MSAAPSPDHDAVIVGAGFSGVYLLYKLREAGFDVLLVDAAAEPGGVWYWNRYPGARVDSQVPIYEFSMPEVWEDWTWTERFPGWQELRAYFRHVCDRLDLWPFMRMATPVKAARFDEDGAFWRLRLGDDENVTTRFLLPALGFASKPYIPDLAGLDDFSGEWCHTARWPQEGVDLTGRRIALIGTGASGVQVAQEAAKCAGQLTIFQRTPILALPMRQQALDETAQTRRKADYPAIFRQRLQTSGGFECQSLDVSALVVTEAERAAHFEDLWQRGGLCFWYNNFADLLTDEEANRHAYAFWRDKVRARIADPALAEKLAPRVPPHPFGTKRPSLEQNYYKIFSQDNVKLVDLMETPIERIVADGIETADEKIACDLLVFATGFDAGRGGLIDMNISGRGGLSLAKAWEHEVRAYLGMAVSGFPNMLFAYGPLSPSGFSNGPTSSEVQGDWIRDFLVWLRNREFHLFEAEASAEKGWTDLVAQAGAMTLFPKADSWYMGANIPGKPRQLINFPSVVGYSALCDDVANNGYAGFAMGRPPTREADRI
ncbi:cyclopentanone 1,2-monooxygenase [Pacificimonas flava]|uniref:Cyclopentanone 1,2-monooxygenase n=2 Tax=Pacificimonas TaxID=1960290 RepID=A0A219B472_9SPHN|nr:MULTISPECIES: NAD(P)/FAD-dependent oxidoreductase [Pacificimonas]MBZ6377118.1 NAD(P)/FAD-dependent oxidoreductase [Pacificimonas aurantium]OWV33155.1 cyclopentanone 1,2-monooxygenase [Pacificimonas flava]